MGDWAGCRRPLPSNNGTWEVSIQGLVDVSMRMVDSTDCGEANQTSKMFQNTAVFNLAGIL